MFPLKKVVVFRRRLQKVVDGWRYKTKMLATQSSLYSLVVTRFLLWTLVMGGATSLSLPVPITVLALLLWRPVLALLGRLVVPDN